LTCTCAGASILASELKVKNNRRKSNE